MKKIYGFHDDVAVQHILPRFGHQVTTTYTNGDSKYAMVPVPIAYPVMSGGTVSRVVVVHPGAKYAVAPTVSFNSQTTAGSGAAATAVINTAGEVIEIRVTNPGSAYEVPPMIEFTEPGGTETVSPYLRENSDSGCKFSTGAIGIWLIRHGAKKVRLEWSAVSGAITASVNFVSSKMWIPGGSLTGADPINSNGFMKYSTTKGMLLKSTTDGSRTFAEFEIPRGVLYDDKGAKIDAFLTVYTAAAIDELRIVEIF